MINETLTFIEEYEESMRNQAHVPAGPVYKNICKRNALIAFKNNEYLRGIYYLSESHAPTYRIRTTYRYDKLSASSEVVPELTMDKQYVEFNCYTECAEEMQTMVQRVEELPPEWTIVQLTTRFNLKESMKWEINKTYTDPIHISIFNCGQRNVQPISLNITAPIDINSDKIEVSAELRSIIDENKHLLTNCFGSQFDLKNASMKQKKNYSERRSILNARLKDVIKVMEKKWLKEWRCVLIGKFVDERIPNETFSKIDEIIKNSGYKICAENKYLLHKIVAGSEYLSSNEMLIAINHCIPDNKDLRGKVYKEMLNISNSFIFKNLQRHPVLLIIDEKLDCFPWEMMDVLTDHPVSRMPSFHFAYALYKEHQSTIKNGYKEVNSSNGSYIINPGLDLKKMEVRLKEFFKYWQPKWNGLVGQTPTSDEFSNCLTNNDIFVYNGHGSGTQFLPGNKIQQMRVNSVVLLFGCSSIRMTSLGPFIESIDVFQNYLIACSPCVVGMIWDVTDFDTDILSTSLLSHWIPSEAEIHWRFIDKVKWEKGTITPSVNQKQKSSNVDWEPELLRAMNIARRESVQFLTKCAIVARGLPVKITS